MTNPQKAAIEEAAKLPTAEETLKRHVPPALYKRGDCYVGHALDAIESHTAAHTAGLRERVKELQSQLAKYRGALERIVNYDYDSRNKAPYHIAKEALKS